MEVPINFCDKTRGFKTEQPELKFAIDDPPRADISVVELIFGDAVKVQQFKENEQNLLTSLEAALLVEKISEKKDFTSGSRS